jgi:valyl-tRNA synthetase
MQQIRRRDRTPYEASVVGGLQVDGGRNHQGGRTFTFAQPRLTVVFGPQRTKAGELVIRPQQCEDEWYRWMANINDWCISRQLWWGHRCPAYYVNIENEADSRANSEYWVAGRDLEEAKQKAASKFPGKTFTLEQDEDVLDTWFSSGLWPFSIMGWPDKVRRFASHIT